MIKSELAVHAAGPVSIQPVRIADLNLIPPTDPSSAALQLHFRMRPTAH